MYTKPFILAAAANFLLFTNLNAYTLLPLHIQRLGGREGEIGTIMAMYSMAAIVSQLTVGGLVDRWGRKPFMLMGTALAAGVSAAFALSSGLGWHFYLLRFLQGAAFSIFITSNLTLLADLAPPDRRAEAVGIFGVSGLVTIALAPAAGEALVNAWGFQAFFAAALLVALGAVALSLAMPMPAHLPDKAIALSAGFWLRFVPVMIAACGFGLANSVVFVFLPPFGREIGLPRVGPFYIVFAVMAVAVRLFGGRVADRLGRVQVIFPCLLGLVVGLALMAVLGSTPLLLLVAAIHGTSHGFIFPAASALAFDLAPAGGRGKALAAFNTANLTGTAAGALGFGWLAQFAGYRLGFGLIAVVLAGACALFRWRG